MIFPWNSTVQNLNLCFLVELYCKFCISWHFTPDFNVFFHIVSGPTYQRLLLFSGSTPWQPVIRRWSLVACKLVPLVWYCFCLVVDPIHWHRSYRMLFLASQSKIVCNYLYMVSIKYLTQYLHSEKCNHMYPPCLMLKLDRLIAIWLKECQKRLLIEWSSMPLLW